MYRLVGADRTAARCSSCCSLFVFPRRNFPWPCHQICLVNSHRPFICFARCKCPKPHLAFAQLQPILPPEIRKSRSKDEPGGFYLVSSVKGGTRSNLHQLNRVGFSIGNKLELFFQFCHVGLTLIPSRQGFQGRWCLYTFQVAYSTTRLLTIPCRATTAATNLICDDAKVRYHFLFVCGGLIIPVHPWSKL